MLQRATIFWVSLGVVIALHVAWLLRPLLGIGDWRYANLSGVLPQVQMTLVVYWIVFGPQPLLIRLAGFVLLFVLDQAWLATSRQYLYFYANLTSGIGAGVLALCLLLWLAGWRLQYVRVTPAATLVPPPMQFSLRFLFIATTVVAVVTLAATSVYRLSETGSVRLLQLWMMVLTTGYTFSFALTAWCMMRMGTWLIPTGLALGASLVIGALCYFLLRQTTGLGTATLWFAMSSVVLALSLAPARGLGYRLLHVRELTEPTN